MQGYIIIIEDERLVAENVAAILTHAGYPNNFITDNLADAKLFLKSHEPLLVISDININGKLIGPQIVAELLKVKQFPVIYLTAYSEEQVLEEALLTGPQAYVLKPFTERQLLVAVKMALLHENNEAANQELTKPSPRELEVIQFLTTGFSSKRIAAELYLSEHTVNTHRRNLLKRYSLESSSELIALSVRNKWIRL